MTYFLRPKILLCWVYWFVAQDIAAQHQFFYGDVFDEHDGLGATPRCMVQDDVGFYWIGTDEGLYRFDGGVARKIPFAFGDSLEKRANHIYNLDFDQQRQVIWASTQTGIVRYDLRQGQATLLHAKSFFNKEDYQTPGSTAVFKDKQGEIWANFAVKGIVHLSTEAQKATAFPCQPAPSKGPNPPSYGNVNIPKYFAQDPFQDSILWVGTRAGLLRFNKSTKQVRHYYYEHPDPFVVVRANPTTCIVAHQDGKIYIGSFNCGLVVFDPHTAHFTHHLIRPTASLEKVRLNYVRAITPISPSKILVSGTDEVFLFDTQTAQMTQIEDQHHFDYRDRSGNYWAFDNGKLILFHHLKNQIPRLLFPDSSYRPQNVHRIQLDTTAQRLYLRVGGIKKVPTYSFLEKKWAMFDLRPNNNEPIGGHVLEKTVKGIFLNNGHVFYNIPYGSIRPVLLPIKLNEAAGWLNSHLSPDGSVYISNHKGFLYQYFPQNGEMKTWVANPSEMPLPDFFTNVSLQAVDAKGRAWMTCYGGFSIFDPSTKVFSYYGSFLKGAHFPSHILAILSDGQGRVWIAGHDEVGWAYCDKPEQGLQQYWNPKNGFGDLGYGVVLDAKGRVWLYLGKKLAVFDPVKNSLRRFDIPNTETLVSLSNGLLAFGHTKGIGLIHPDSLLTNTEQPRPYVSYIKIFDKTLPLSGNLFAQPDLYLSPDENFLSFGFSALGTLDPQQYRFAYQLEGVDKDWVYPEQGDRIAGYTALQGGDYSFRLKVSNNLGEWSQNVYEWRVHVATPWWATWQFRTLLALSILGFVYFLVKNRLRQQTILLENQRLVLEQERSLRAERDRIASEMHDDLGAGLSTIRMLSLTAKRRETDPDQANRIDKIARSAADVMERMADIIWMMNSQNDTLENFTAYLRRYAAEYLDTHGIALQFDMPETMPPFPLSSLQRRNLLLVVKECLHNAVKYSQATQIHISIKINYKLIVCIQDNGVGFLEKPSDLGNTGGNGLKNIRARMAQIGGTVNFSTQSGTAVTIEL